MSAAALLALAMAAPVTAQPNRLADGTEFGRSRLYLRDLRILETTGFSTRGEHLVLDATGDRVTDGPTSILLSDVELIETAEGTNAGRFAAIGAGVAALGALLAVASLVDEHGEDAVGGSAADVVILSVAVGAGIGAAIGAGRPRWRTTYVRPGSV